MELIKILDHEISVDTSDTFAWPEGSLGKCSVHSCEILLKAGLPDDITNCTFIHEVVHVIADLSSIGLEEQDVDGLALGFYSFLKNNQEMVEKLWSSGRMV